MISEFDFDKITYSMYSDKQNSSNCVDPDQTPHNVASGLGLHCLPFIQQFYTHSEAKQWTCRRDV